MDLAAKLTILADSAKYDASCASSGNNRGAGRGIGATRATGVCHSWSADGRCISLLKLLFSNHCVYDCAYCAIRRSNDVRRVSFTVDELVTLTIDFYRRNYIEGLFLSSGISGDPDYTMGKLCAVATRLRREEHFNGYIHLKAIPGASERLLNNAGLFADRMSVNIELPSEKSLSRLAPQKTKKAIIGTMGHVADRLLETREDAAHQLRHTPTFVPAGQSTQLIVGASPESDRSIMTLSSYFYRRVGMRRVYYSAFMPVSDDTRLPLIGSPPLRREHRLYQADWLIRLYKFELSDLFSEEQENIDSDLDPKAGWALRNYHLFPVEVQHADYEMLLRVPGIGLQTATRIIRFRRTTRLTFDLLRRFGVVMKRARYFITCNGGHLESRGLSLELLRLHLSDAVAAQPWQVGSSSQLELFESGRMPSRSGNNGTRDSAHVAGTRVPMRLDTRSSRSSRSNAQSREHHRDGVRIEYDGTFVGVLSLLQALSDEPTLQPAVIIKAGDMDASERDLFASTITIDVDESAAKRFAGDFPKQRSARHFELLYHAFLSDVYQIELAMIDFARNGQNVNARLLLEKAERRTLHDVHLFLGIVRFRLLQLDLLQADMEPDCDILRLLAPHFARRMPHERWCIVDRKRDTVALYENGGLHFADHASDHITPSGDSSTGCEGLDRMESLWHDYVRHIAIEERRNPSLQQHFLPKKYWRHLTEMAPHLHPSESDD